MEESIEAFGGKDFLACYKACLGLKPVEAGVYSPLVLAYVGDAVYELIVRARVVNAGNVPVNRLHKHSASLVKAGAQAAMLRQLEPLLTPEEKAVYRRGRNAKSVTTAKNASVIDYRMATGLEALVGWLFLDERYGRLVELLGIGLEALENPQAAAGLGGLRPEEKAAGPGGSRPEGETAGPGGCPPAQAAKTASGAAGEEGERK